MRYGTKVVGVSRAGRDLLVDSGRETDPFAVHVQTAAGHERLLASAVVDASGTWTQPNPLGADGYPALGEREHADRFSYGIPDFNDPAVAARYAGKHVAVAGKGASAQGVLIGLAKLARHDDDSPRPGCPGCCAAPASGTRSVAATTTSSSSAASSARTPRQPPPAGWSPTSPSSAPSPSPPRPTDGSPSPRSTASR